MSNTNPESGVVRDYNAPDIHDEDTASVQNAINESYKQREAAKEANRAKVLRIKRRNWLWHLVHWLVHYAGIGSMIYLLFLLRIPGGVALAMAILAIAASAYRLKFIARAYPKK